MKMNPATLVEMSDVVGRPKVKMTLPVPLRIGDRIHLAFQLRRVNGGRSEVLDISGDFRITAVSFDASNGPTRQILAVESAGKAPTWRAVKTVPAPERKLGPTRFPRTSVV
jgi:hypothetical protein